MLHFLEKAPPTNEISDHLNSLWVPVQISSPLRASVSHLQQRGSRVRRYPGFVPALTRKAAQLLLHCACVCVCPSLEPSCTADAPDGQGVHHRLPGAHTALCWHGAPLKLASLSPCHGAITAAHHMLSAPHTTSHQILTTVLPGRYCYLVSHVGRLRLS